MQHTRNRLDREGFMHARRDCGHPEPAGFSFVPLQSLQSLQSSCQRCRLRMVQELGLDAPVRRGHVIATSMGPYGFL